MHLSGPRGPRLSSFHVARRTNFREQYYTGTRRYKCVREDCRQYQGETICTFVMVICSYLWINVFVWALVFCGIRYYQFASWDCSGVIRRIHMRKIRRGQGQSTWWKSDRFHAQRPLDKPKWTSQGPGVRADAQCHHTTWLEELASESNTIQAQEDISVSGKIAGNIKVKLYVILWWFFINISGLINSFELSSCVVLDIISLLPWIAAGPSRKSIWERLGGIKVRCTWQKSDRFHA